MTDARWNQDPNVGTVKHDAGKRRMALLPPELLRGVIDVLTLGEKKYGTFNWAKGGPGNGYSRYYDSLMRHLDAFWSGEDSDPETGLHHLDHLIANAVFLRYYTQRWPELDDRPELFPVTEDEGTLGGPFPPGVAAMVGFQWPAFGANTPAPQLATMPPEPVD